MTLKSVEEIDDEKFDFELDGDIIRSNLRKEKRKKIREVWYSISSLQWSLAGLYLFLFKYGISIISWTSFTYFFLIHAGARFVFANIGYALDWSILTICSKIMEYPTPAMGRAIQIMSLLSIVGTAILVFFTADWVINAIKAR